MNRGAQGVRNDIPSRDHDELAFADRCAAKGEPIGTFYPEQTGKPATRAKALCVGCPVRQDCLSYALKYGEQWGIWGGFNVKERRVIKRKVRDEGADLIAMLDAVAAL